MRGLFTLGVVATAVMANQAATADSFAINEYSPLDLGRANAGRAVLIGDAAGAFTNPALMTVFSSPIVSASLHQILGSADFSNRGSTDAIGQPLVGDDEGILEDSTIPAVYAIIPLAERFALGLSVNVPFGLATDYNDNWAGRYQALKSELVTVNINPSIAYEVNEELSIGVGISAQYADAELTNAVDFGAVCFGALAPDQCFQLGLIPQAADGNASVKGDSWGVGFNVGVTWSPDPRLRLGAHYRSSVDHTLDGEGEFDVPAQALPLTLTGAFTDGAAEASIELPSSWEFGMSYEMTDRLTGYVSFQWTEWSSVDELRVEFDNPAQPDSVEELAYKDAGRVSIGVDYEISPEWTVRGGYAFDGTPTQAATRTARIPDNDRHVFAAGASWTPNDRWQVDAGYNRIQIENISFQRTGAVGDMLQGQYQGHANVISVGVTRRFG